ncbi:DUF2924 domain-containing protein [bacterium]|nr:DUF2924 domain-containing protein [bacterium]
MEISILAEPAHRKPNGTELARDPRLPAVGSVLKRDYRGKTYRVLVTDDGFMFDGRRCASLSAIAKEITGTAWNGFLFFTRALGLKNRREAAA